MDANEVISDVQMLIKALRRRKSVVVGRREDGTLDIDSAIKEQRPATEKEEMLKKHLASYDRFQKRWSNRDSDMARRVKYMTADIREWEASRAKIPKDERPWFCSLSAIDRAEMVILTKKILQDSRVFRLKTIKNKWGSASLSSIDL